MLYIGTSGYSYDDWVGPYYPPGTPKSAFLELYARQFNAVEVNYTYYTMPSARTLAAMARKTGAGFRFAVKAHGSITHEGGGAERMRAFAAELAPLTEQGKFACILAQFPNSFRLRRESVDYLRLLPEDFGGLPVVVEFRNREWADDRAYEFLRTHGLGFCCVDEPDFPSLMPRLALATSEIGYVRFHGRNAAKWWRHDEAWERYDYLYSREELAEWIPRVEALRNQGARETYVFFNNHYQGQAAQNAELFTQMLREARLVEGAQSTEQ